ncbi:MAG: SBBP repeat-containing protein [Pyrinomonadaceae bacterium]
MKRDGFRSNAGSGLRYLCAFFGVALMVWTVVLPMPSVAESTDAAVKNNADGSAVNSAAEKPAPTLDGLQTSMGDASAYFEENVGQFDEKVKYLARGAGGYDLFLTATDAVYVVHERGQARSGPWDRGAEHLPPKSKEEADELQQPQHATAVYMTLSGARRDAAFSGTEMLEHKTNYFKGRKENWRTNIANYRRVETRGIYNGVDMVWHGRERGGVQYDFIVQPGADASQIGWDIRGARSAEIDAEGSLIIHTDYGDIRQARPFTYQDVNGARQEVASSFTIDNTVRGDSIAHIGFLLGEYDTTKPLTIDPSVNLSNLSFSTFLGGGTGSDLGYAIAVDSADNVYVTGVTPSPTFPTTPGTVDTSHNGSNDAFVTKLNAAGTALIYSTYLGGSGIDIAYGIAIDPSGNAFVTGYTSSTAYPTTAGA